MSSYPASTSLTCLLSFFPPLAEQYDNKGSDVATTKHRAGEDFQAFMAQAKDLTNSVNIKFFDYV